MNIAASKKKKEVRESSFCYEVVTGELGDLKEGENDRKMSSKVWPAKNVVCKGRSPEKNALKFGSDSICNTANMSARMPKLAFLRF